MSEEKKDQVSEIILEIVNVEKKYLYGNRKNVHTQRRAEIRSIIETYYKKQTENKKK